MPTNLHMKQKFANKTSSIWLQQFSTLSRSGAACGLKAAGNQAYRTVIQNAIWEEPAHASPTALQLWRIANFSSNGRPEVLSPVPLVAPVQHGFVLKQSRPNVNPRPVYSAAASRQAASSQRSGRTRDLGRRLRSTGLTVESQQCDVYWKSPTLHQLHISVPLFLHPTPLLSIHPAPLSLPSLHPPLHLCSS